jgi:hypothetical protein
VTAPADRYSIRIDFNAQTAECAKAFVGRLSKWLVDTREEPGPGVWLHRVTLTETTTKTETVPE